VRIAAAYALGWFPEEAGASLPPLRQAATAGEPAVAATALVAMGLIGAEDEQRLAEPMLDDPRAAVRWAAAVALANLRGPAAGARVAAELLAWSGGPSESWPEIPFREGDLAGYAGLALRQLGEAQDEAAFDALIARLPQVSGTEALTVVAVALDRAFPGGPDHLAGGGQPSPGSLAWSGVAVAGSDRAAETTCGLGRSSTSSRNTSGRL
jgi:hypothetical protein